MNAWSALDSRGLWHGSCAPSLHSRRGSLHSSTCRSWDTWTKSNRIFCFIWFFAKPTLFTSLVDEKRDQPTGDNLSLPVLLYFSPSCRSKCWSQLTVSPSSSLVNGELNRRAGFFSFFNFLLLKVGPGSICLRGERMQLYCCVFVCVRGCMCVWMCMFLFCGECV